jgi:cytochrome c oxidase subunit 3
MRTLGIRAHPLVFGVVVFLASESMLFAGLLAAWYDLRGLSTTWIPAGAELDFNGAAFGTALLGLGSVTMGIAQWAAANRKRGIARGMLVLTLFCALAFVVIALRTWRLANFSVSTNAFGTLFFVLTGVHLAHVVVGAILLSALTIFLGKAAFTSDNHAGVEAIAYYWHFVFIVWVGLWATIYLVH